MRPDKGPVGIGDAVTGYLARSGLEQRVRQASVIEEWARLVGPQVSRVTEPESIAQDGTLFVKVATPAWAQELQLQTPMVLARLREGGRPIKRIVWKAGGGP